MLPLYSMVWDLWWVSEAEPMLFCWLMLLSPFLSSTVFPILFFLSVKEITFYNGLVLTVDS